MKSRKRDGEREREREREREKERERERERERGRESEREREKEKVSEKIKSYCIVRLKCRQDRKRVRDGVSAPIVTRSFVRQTYIHLA